MPAGRPPRSTEPTRMVGVRLTDTERERYEDVCTEDESLSDFLRTAANREAERREGIAQRRRPR